MPASLPREPPVGVEQLERVVVRQRGSNPLLAPRHFRRRPERIDHRLLGRVHDRLEDVVQRGIGYGLSRRFAARAAAPRCERDEDLAARGGRSSRCGRDPGRRDAPRARAGGEKGVRRRPRPRCSSLRTGAPSPLRHRAAGRRGRRRRRAGAAGRSSTGRAGRTAVTLVRATTRPSGGSGSSRETMTWPTATPSTSAIASSGPASNRPIRRP